MKAIRAKHDTVSLNVDNYLKDYLRQLGVAEESLNDFLVPDAEGKLDRFLDLDNGFDAAQALLEELEKGESVFIQADCDADGYTSASIMAQYLHQRFPDTSVTLGVHSGKEHGVEIDKALASDAKIVIIPDAGSNQFEEQRQLSEAGKVVIILDHHELDDDYPITPNVYIVNNQSSHMFNNKALSGAGVTLLFVNFVDNLHCNRYGLESDIWKAYADLAAVGIIADVMDTRPIGNNTIIKYGLSHIRNKLLQQILFLKQYGIADIANPTKLDISFYVAPIINGLIRSGTQEEKETFLKAMADNNITETITSTTARTTHTETIYQYAARIAANAKGRQDTAKERGSLILNTKIKANKLDEHAVIIVPINASEQEKIPSTLTGLTAMELSKAYHKPVLVLRESCSDDGVVTYSGSLRADQYYEEVDGDVKPVPSMMEMINQSKLGWAEGHPFAAGCGFTGENLRKFLDFADKRMENVDFSAEYVDVEYWFDRGVFSQKVIQDFAQGNHIYGTGIPEPRLAFNFTVDVNEVSVIGKNNDTIKFNRNGVEFIMFKQPKLARKIKEGIKNDIVVVGKSTINNYNHAPQIIVESMDVTPSKTVSVFDLI